MTDTPSGSSGEAGKGIKANRTETTVLVIDDQIAGLRAILDYLIEYGFVILVAEDGESGLERAKYARPDIILLDVRMPGLDGFEVCRRLKADKQTAQISVIFMTSLADIEDKVTGFAVGGVDYITKPFQTEEVLARLNTHLTLHRLQQRLETQNAQLQHQVTIRRQAEVALQRSHAELERRVALRTSELKQTNEQLIAEIEERKRIEAALRQSEERYRNLVESAPDVIYTLSPEATITSLNPAFEGITGWHPTEWVGQSFARLLHPEDRPQAMIFQEQVMQGKTPPVFELRIQTRSGGYGVGEVTNTPLWQEGQVVGVLGIARNITARKQAEAETRQRNRELALLNRVIAASATETEPETILEIVCRELALAFEVPQAAATFLNEEKTEAVVVAEYRTEDRPAAMGQVIPAKDNPSFQYLLKNKVPLVVEDAQNNPRLAPIRDLIRARGTVSLLLIPLIIAGEVVGSLGLDALEPRGFLPEEVALAGSVADQVSGVLARLRLDAQRQRLEAQYYQAQKMEAVGRLVGGVAHDFNNILTVINGYSELLLQRHLGPQHPIRREVEQILESGKRAARLTRQLLAFSRQQVLQPRVLDLNQIVVNMEKMLHRLIGEDIVLEAILEPQLRSVKADPGQIEQVIMNLAINARDAMPEGGKLTIETANVVLDEKYARQHLEIQPGPFVMLAVSDTGSGMDAETRAHIFEPFFTTKRQGTGLGLATVYGIINQSGGQIWVYSEPGQGTTIKIYLPQTEATVDVVTPSQSLAESKLGAETILLVEDEDLVRELARQTLIGSGYTVLEAGDGEQAHQVNAAYQGVIHLLVTDVVMPGGINGAQLAKELVSLRPEMKVLYTSGYTENAIVHHGVLDAGIAFLAKPFSPNELLRKVRQTLDGETP